MTTHKDRPHYSEGVLGDGAAILRDGVPMRVDEIVAALNANPVTPAAQPANHHGTTLVSPEESLTVQLLRARVAELEAAQPLFWFIDHGPADGVEFFDHSDEVVAMKRGATPLYANPVTPAAQAVDVCRAALEDACVVSWISADLSTIDGAKRAIAALCAFDVQLATDPATNGGKVLIQQPVADEVVRDAERYRWMRDVTGEVSADALIDALEQCGEEFDKAIDAAIAAEQAKEAPRG